MSIKYQINKIAGPLAHGRVRSLKTFQFFHLSFQTLQLVSLLVSFLCFLVARVAAPGTLASKSTRSFTAMTLPNALWTDFSDFFGLRGNFEKTCVFGITPNGQKREDKSSLRGLYRNFV
jgi:hypothetical protein